MQGIIHAKAEGKAEGKAQGKDPKNGGVRINILSRHFWREISMKTFKRLISPKENALPRSRKGFIIRTS
jgi:hypothetical protein